MIEIKYSDGCDLLVSLSEEYCIYVAVEADGVPFGKDDTVTAYLVSFLNLLNRVQSCDDNNLLLGANCEEDHPLMKSYSNHLRKEMEQIEKKTLTTEIVGLCSNLN